jgi:undecaprenyl-diphosphatase
VSPLEALVLGIVQGFAEFLPVSSSGHLVVFQTLMEVGDSSLLFEIAVHVATMLAIVIFFRKKILELMLGCVARRPESLTYVGKLVVGTLPAIVVALVAKNYLDRVLSSPYVSGVGLLVTGCILWTTRTTLKRAHQQEPSWNQALLVGVAQAFAILPGISRSGTTVAAALALGIAPAVAAEFSFLLGIIAITGAAVLMLPDLAAASPEMITALGIGCAAALVSGILAIWLFVILLRKQAFYAFAYYAWAVGGAFSLWLYLR